MKIKQHINSISYKIILSGALLSLLVSLAPATSTVVNAGTAQKSSSGTYLPSSVADVEIRINAPSSAQKNIEVSFALDASGSMATQIGAAKTKVKNFAHWVWDNGLQGRTTITVTSFGYETCAQSSDDPHLIVHVNKQKLTSRTSIDTSVDTVTTSPMCNFGNPGDPKYYGFSDITEGMRYGSSFLSGQSTNATTEKFLVLMSDGFHNMARYGSGGGSYNGICPLYVNAGDDTRDASISHNWNQFIVVQSSSVDNSKTLLRDYAAGTGLSPYLAPCESFLDARGNMTAKSFLTRIANAFEGGSEKTIDEAISNVQDSLINAIKVNDYLNTDVFTDDASTISSITVVNCANNANVPGANILSSDNRIYGTIPYSSSISTYCIRFKAQINSNPTPGTPNINSPDEQVGDCSTIDSSDTSKNVIWYIDATGKVNSCDTISLGQVTIVSGNDIRASYLRVVGYNTSTGAKVNKNVFLNTERLYFDSYVSNLSTWSTYWQHRINYYRDTSSYQTYAQYNWVMPANSTRWVQSFPGGINEAMFPSSKYWTMPAGNYTARMVTNYYNDPVSGNNTASDTYAVVSLPTNLTVDVDDLLCRSARVTWTPGGNTVNHDIDLLPEHGANYPINDISGNSYTFQDLQPETTYRWRLSPNASLGDSDQWTTYATFTTPECPKYSAGVGSPINLIPGKPRAEVAGNGTVTIDYTPNRSSWDKHDATIQIRVVGIRRGEGQTCSGLAAGGAVSADLSGIHARLSGSSLAYTTVDHDTGSPVTFDIYADSGTPNDWYTVCFGIRDTSGNVDTPDAVYPLVVELKDVPWLQVTSRNDTANTWTGDIHSNGPISINVPSNNFLFRSGTAGVVTATGSITPGLSRIASAANQQWGIPTYQTYEMRRFQSLVDTLSVNLSFANTPPSSANLNAAMNGHCAGRNPVIINVNPGAGNTWNMNKNLNLQGSGNCHNKDIIFQVSGDMNVTTPINNDGTNTNLLFITRGNTTINQNITDANANNALVFLSSGDVTVAPTVSQLDGVHIFGGTFRSGSSDTQLNVRGSLIGLGDNIGGSNSGSFTAGAGEKTLQRDLGFGNGSQPGEKILYQPKYLYLLRGALGEATYTWSE